MQDLLLLTSSSSAINFLGKKFVKRDNKEVKLSHLSKSKLILVIYSASW